MRRVLPASDGAPCGLRASWYNWPEASSHPGKGWACAHLWGEHSKDREAIRVVRPLG